MPLTASDLYAFTQCPYRVYRDKHDDQSLRDPVNEFVQLLWERGMQYEKIVLKQFKKNAPTLDLSHEADPKERFRKTIQGMKDGILYIIHG